MNQELWKKILAFDFDHPPSEYGFTTRLEHENFWTCAFANQAILEYKKFMFLAATSDFMVSPSEIVDTVWHQHLIFTQSYQDFCALLGKQIQHIPSTHNAEDFQKFHQAKERTTLFYERDFGKQPEDIWSYAGMFESLNLEKAKFKIRTFLVIGILAFICCTVPAYFLLRPIYSEIENPNFIIGFIAIVGVTTFFLERFNNSKLNKIVSGFSKASFVYNLQPFELVFLETQRLANVINGTVNELVENGTIAINNNNVELVKRAATINKEQLQVTTILSSLGSTYYPNLLKNLVIKPIFKNIPNSMDAFKKYFNKSKKFGFLFYTNFIILGVLLLLAFTRIVTGVLRDKPVFEIVVVTIALAIGIHFYLQRLTEQIATGIIPNLYKQEILPKIEIKTNWQWDYFLYGTAALTTSFIPLANFSEKRNGVNGSDGYVADSSGWETSCGSSCSSCGGCGGGD
jgi:hypothetical protein